MNRLTTIAVSVLFAGALVSCGNADEQQPTPTPTTTTSSNSETTTSSSSSTTVATSSESVPEAPVVVQDEPVPAPAPAPAPGPAVSSPTFNPDSADGYGPDQRLPPLCERFPGEFDCNDNPIPPQPSGECIGYGCSPEQDAELNRAEAEANNQYQ